MVRGSPRSNALWPTEWLQSRTPPRSRLPFEKPQMEFIFPLLSAKRGKPEAGEVVQKRRTQCNHEDQGRIPAWTSQTVCPVYTHNPSSKGREARKWLGLVGFQSSGENTSLGFRERPCLKGVDGEWEEVSQCLFLASIHVHRCTHTHMCTHSYTHAHIHNF